MQFDNAFSRETGVPRDLREVRSELTAIADRDLNETAFGMSRFPGAGRSLHDERFDFRVSAPPRIEIDQHGSKRRMQVANPRQRFIERLHEPEDLLMRVERNAVSKRDQE